jgi:hypothetical protein
MALLFSIIPNMMALSSVLGTPRCLHNTSRGRQSACPSHSLVVCAAAPRTEYKSPSSRVAATELEYLERFTTVVPDTLLLQDIEKIEAPKAATVSSAVLSGILRNPAGLQEYKVLHQGLN